MPRIPKTPKAASPVSPPIPAAPATRSRARRNEKVTPTPAEVAQESAAIYPDTFDTPPSAEDIAAEAYAIYQARGGGHGRHDDDWFEAERRVSERRRQRG